MSAIEKFLQAHKLNCKSRRYSAEPLPCNCGRDAAAEELAALQARIAELEKIEVAAKMWRRTWVDDEDVREMESGCQCNICNLVRSVEGAK